eukprot:scaffold7272_cov124-Skeletonema_dohrnii-CCMP3373.AAC.6
MATNQPKSITAATYRNSMTSMIVYDNLLRYGNKSPNLTKVAREKLIELHRFSKAAAALNPNSSLVSPESQGKVKVFF